MGIASESDDRSITCLECTAVRKLVAVAVAVGIVVVAGDYKGVVDVAVGENQSWNHLNFE